jgi:hypothetical protein
VAKECGSATTRFLIGPNTTRANEKAGALWVKLGVSARCGTGTSYKTLGAAVGLPLGVNF